MHIGSLKPASNRGRYNEIFQLYDTEAPDEGVDLTGATITLEIRKSNCSSPEITATNGSDAQFVVTDADEGVFELTLTAATMRNLDPGTYEVGITIESADAEANGDETITQYFAGTLPVLDGIVS
jgi:hypothetical protein